MENIKLRQLAIEFFENHLNPTEDDLYDFLEENEWRIYDDYQINSFKNIIKIELDEAGYDVKNIPEKLLDFMAKDLEESAFDEDRFRDGINGLFDWYRRDLEEYKLEGDNEENI